MAHDLAALAPQARCAWRGDHVGRSPGLLVAASPASASGPTALASGKTGPDETVVAKMASGSG